MWTESIADCYLRSKSDGASSFISITTSGPVLFCDFSVDFLSFSAFKPFSWLLRFLTALFFDFRCFSAVPFVAISSVWCWPYRIADTTSALACLDFLRCPVLRKLSANGLWGKAELAPFLSIVVRVVNGGWLFEDRRVETYSNSLLFKCFAPAVGPTAIPCLILRFWKISAAYYWTSELGVELASGIGYFNSYPVLLFA